MRILILDDSKTKCNWIKEILKQRNFEYEEIAYLNCAYKKILESPSYYQGIILDIENLACDLIDALKKDYSNLLKSRYDLESDTFFLKSYEILNQIALKRGFFMSKGELDIRRTANMILDEFRAAKLGKITLDLI